MSENPFKSPLPAKEMQSNSFHYRHDGSGRTFVVQVKVICWLMIVQAVLLLIFGIFCAGYALVAGNLESIMPPEAQAEFRQQMPEQQLLMLTWVFGIWSVFAFVMCVLNFVTAYYNFSYRKRGLGIVTLLIGIGSMLTCYCAPTGIALSIYGLIIYFNPATAEAFRLRDTGLSTEEMLRHFVK